ncbi:hypothetical protein [Trichothermofontia sp.]
MACGIAAAIYVTVQVVVAAVASLRDRRLGCYWVDMGWQGAYPTVDLFVEISNCATPNPRQGPIAERD